MITQWNESEDDALQGLPLRAQIIYLRGLRRHMNYATGIVGGVDRRISLKMLGEISEETINRQPNQPNKKQVIISLEQLKKSGLIERVEDKDYLIFFLPKATTHHSVQNNHGTTTAQPRHNHGTDHGTTKPSNTAGSEDNHGIDQNGELLPPTGTTAHIRNTGIRYQEKVKEKNIKKESVKIMLADYGITEQLASDFIEHRNTKKAPITKTALNGFNREAEKAKISMQAAIQYAIERGWTGFKADWYENKSQQETNHERNARERREAILSNDF